MQMSFFYLICFIASIAMIAYYVCSDESHSIWQTIMVVLITVANAGYLAVALAKNLQEALLANKLIYVGGCFLPMVSLLILCEICRVRVKQWLLVFMCSLQICLYLLVCTIGYCPIYYETASFDIVGQTGVLSRTYGPAHILYPITMYGYTIVGIIIAVYAVRKKALVSRKLTMLLVAGYGIVQIGYVFERIIGLKIEIIPMLYMIAFYAFVAILRRSEAYSVSESIQKMLDQQNINGYISFNKKMHYLGCNDYAAKILPELTKLALDKPVPYGEHMVYHRIKPALERFVKDGEQEKEFLRIRNMTFEIKINQIRKNNGNIKGYMIELLNITEHQKYLEMVENYNRNLESEVEGKTHKIREIQDQMTLGMAQIVESRDHNTGGHIKRTSSVVKVFARKLLRSDYGFSQQFLYYIQKSAPMHDLGKIAVDDAILRKQGKFTDEEYEEMKKHPLAGAKIVEDILSGVETEEFVRIAKNVAHYHHEKMDGTGYPEHLKGEAIPIEARIMALADVFDALVSKRCYKEAYSYDRAFGIIEESLGSHFDEKLGRIFISCRPELEELYNGFLEDEG